MRRRWYGVFVFLSMLTLLAFRYPPTYSRVAGVMSNPVIQWGSPLNKGLLHWWLYHPNISGGGTVFKNLTGRVNGILTNMATPSTTTSGWQRTTSRRGGLGEIRCDGTNDVISTTGATFTQSGGAVAVWINPTSTASGRPWTDSGGGYVYLEFTAADTVQLNLFTTGGALQSGGVTFTAGSWQHALGVWNSAGAFLYKNGILAASNTSGTGVLDPAATFSIGVCDDATLGPFAPFNGAVDDLRMWGRPLSAAEAYQVYIDSMTGYTSTLQTVPMGGYVANVVGAPARSRRYVY